MSLSSSELISKGREKKDQHTWDVWGQDFLIKDHLLWTWEVTIWAYNEYTAH